MGFFDHDDARDANEQVYGYEGEVQEEHKAKFSHELIAGAAGFEAMKAYEDHLRKIGQPVTHSTMKELLAGFAAAEVDKLFESKGMCDACVICFFLLMRAAVGLDFIDREKAKHHAKEQAEHLAKQRYGEGNTGYEYANQ